MHNYFRLLKSAKGYLFTFIGAVVCLVAETVFGGISLIALVPVVDKVLNGKNVIISPSIKIPLTHGVESILNAINNTGRLQLLWYIGGFWILMFFLKGIFTYYKEVLMERMGQGVVRDLRKNIYGHVQNLSLDYIGRQRAGELVSRITNDVQWVRDGIARGLANSLSSFAELFLYLAFLIIIAWKLSMVCLIVFGVLMLPVITIGRLLRSLSSKGQSKMADINSILFETISGMRVVKAFGMEDYEKERFSKENKRYYSLMMKAIRKGAVLGPMVECVGAVVAVGILFLFAPSLINGSLTLGFFVLYIGSLVAIIKPVKKVAQMNSIIQRAVAASDRIFSLLDINPEVTEKRDSVELSPFNNNIKLIDVHFGYKGKDTVLKGIDLEIKKGEVIAFVGPSGVGKTTLLNLIPRFHDPTKGRIEVDGHNIRDLDLNSLRKQLGVVTQETILFHDTVRANIAYGDQKRSMDEIIRAAEMANAHHFIIQMPKGYDTVIGERGFKLSGGEKQRIAIARAILKNPAVLILDEATSALDTESERLVQDALNKLMQHRTVLVIAHRLSTIQQANCIVVLKHGHIEQKGTHQELVSVEGPYKTLYEMQFNL